MKKIFALLMTVILAVSFCACAPAGSNEDTLKIGWFGGGSADEVMELFRLRKTK